MEPTSFHQILGSLRVGSIAEIDNYLAGDQYSKLLGPHADDDADAEVLHHTRTCYLPPDYVPFFLAVSLIPKFPD